MSKLTLMRSEQPLPEGPAMDAVKGFLFGVVDGFTEPDRKAWNRFWNRVKRMEAGELWNLEMVFPRSGAFHRRHMKIEQSVFDAQERFQDFEAFRCWVKIGAGHCEWVPGPKGAIVPIPKSIAYASMDDQDFRVFHENTIQFLRGDHAANVLWPHLKGQRAAEMMDSILQGFEE